jgi:2-iminobutanoate/2-iminopropanoate deaminase
MADVIGVPSPYTWDAPFRYSQATRIGDLIFVSGQAAVGPEGTVVGEGDFDAQAAQVFANLEAVLAAAGSSLRKVAKANIYLTDMSYFPKVLELRDRHFVAPYPADTTVEVTALALPGLMIEIDVIATV